MDVFKIDQSLSVGLGSVPAQCAVPDTLTPEVSFDAGGEFNLSFFDTPCGSSGGGGEDSSAQGFSDPGSVGSGASTSPPPGTAGTLPCAHQPAQQGGGAATNNNNNNNNNSGVVGSSSLSLVQQLPPGCVPKPPVHIGDRIRASYSTYIILLDVAQRHIVRLYTIHTERESSKKKNKKKKKRMMMLESVSSRQSPSWVIHSLSLGDEDDDALAAAQALLLRVRASMRLHKKLAFVKIKNKKF
ncbi:unnamed protein product [Trichogramma brassicae]|uniref:Uncharacterized protein n=1 Tax=Trichogramma brassicae TaxID=86971 RepID=A0A6H5ISK3_9HYME|nr:unnamed protein product [Trichogramma brassicae]